MKHALRLFTLLALSIVMMSGCGAGDSTAEEDLEERQPQETIEGQQVDNAVTAQVGEDINEEQNLNLRNNHDLEQMISTEKGIERAVIAVIPGEYRRVLVDLEVDEEKGLAPGEVADHYSTVIKDRYPDHMVDIIVTQDGALLTQVTYE